MRVSALTLLELLVLGRFGRKKDSGRDIFLLNCGGGRRNRVEFRNGAFKVGLVEASAVSQELQTFSVYVCDAAHT